MTPGRATRVLVVCMGNICRSPTAEGVLRALAKASRLDLVIESAGTLAYHEGEAPDLRSQRAAAARGYDLSSIRARRVNDEDFESFDLVLAMDRDNLGELRARCPEPLQEKLGLFLRYARNADTDEVPDPYYGGPGGFDRVLDLIEDASAGLLDELALGG